MVCVLEIERTRVETEGNESERYGDLVRHAQRKHRSLGVSKRERRGKRKVRKKKVREAV